MTDFIFSDSRPGHWDRMCDEKGALFSSGAWLELLERSFNCRTLYASNEEQGFAVSVFRGGPFKIGYLGFPVGGGVGKTVGEKSIAHALEATEFGGMPICVRISSSAFESDAQLELPCQRNPETVIENLQSWSLGSVSKNLRRDVKKAQRSGIRVSRASRSVLGGKLYDIYSQTVKRHGGALRYNAGYFQGLLDLAVCQPRLRVLIASLDGHVAGFAVTARHGGTTCYLHGGADPEHRKNSPSDLLLDRAIHDAQRDGSQKFNLMASPDDQPSLVRYKEKWGGVTRDLRTYTVALSPSYRLFRLAEKLYRFVR